MTNIQITFIRRITWLCISNSPVGGKGKVRILKQITRQHWDTEREKCTMTSIGPSKLEPVLHVDAGLRRNTATITTLVDYLCWVRGQIDGGNKCNCICRTQTNLTTIADLLVVLASPTLYLLTALGKALVTSLYWFSSNHPGAIALFLTTLVFQLECRVHNF